MTRSMSPKPIPGKYFCHRSYWQSSSLPFRSWEMAYATPSIRAQKIDIYAMIRAETMVGAPDITFRPLQLEHMPPQGMVTTPSTTVYAMIGQRPAHPVSPEKKLLCSAPILVQRHRGQQCPDRH